MTSSVETTGGRVEVLDLPAVDGAEALAPLVFLHEGLGCVTLWRDIPALVQSETGGRRAVVYSRHGYGQSAPADLPRPVDYMHHEADVVLPELLAALDLDDPVLIGHSDGASIALLYAGAGRPVDALVLLAPHVFVEAESIAGVEAARDAYENTELRARLARYHRHVDVAFRGWADAWISAEFRSWNIEDRLPRIGCPVLAIQGDADNYGTVAQIDAIDAGVTGPVRRLWLDGAGHAPQFDATDEVVTSIAAFVNAV